MVAWQAKHLAKPVEAIPLLAAKLRPKKTSGDHCVKFNDKRR